MDFFSFHCKCKCTESFGNNISEIYFQNNNKIEGVYMNYTFDGQLVQKINYIDGKKNGEAFFYIYIHLLRDDPDWNYGINHNDIISKKCNYINDKKDGECIYYDMDGNIEQVYYYKNGVKINKN